MHTYKNLTLIGTSHISKESVREVEKVILDKKPEIVAIELDRIRLESLLRQKRRLSVKDIKKVGFKGFLFAFIGHWVEKKLGEIVKVKPGSEMIKAIETARKTNSRIALIDQDIRVTLKKISKGLTLREKLRFVSDVLKSFFIKTKIEFDLRKVPEQEIIKKMTEELKKRYPTLYNVLIEERNFIMAKNLYKLMKTDKTIIAVVGAGHENRIIKILKDLEDVR